MIVFGCGVSFGLGYVMGRQVSGGGGCLYVGGAEKGAVAGCSGDWSGGCGLWCGVILGPPVAGGFCVQSVVVVRRCGRCASRCRVVR